MKCYSITQLVLICYNVLITFTSAAQSKKKHITNNPLLSYHITISRVNTNFYNALNVPWQLIKKKFISWHLTYYQWNNIKIWKITLKHWKSLAIFELLIKWSFQKYFHLYMKSYFPFIDLFLTDTIPQAYYYTITISMENVSSTSSDF